MVQSLAVYIQESVVTVMKGVVILRGKLVENSSILISV